MMLHTDAFNKNAKTKMTKADYVKNAASSEAAIEVLEVSMSSRSPGKTKLTRFLLAQYLYDNLTLTQFIYVDGDTNPFMNMNMRRPSENSALKLASLTAGGSKDSKGKIDTYLIISQVSCASLLLCPLRA